MAPVATFHFERELAASTDEIVVCLLDPISLARCIPGVTLTTADGNSMTGRIRIKQAAVPSVYSLSVELSGVEADSDEEAETTPLVVDGMAEEQRSGTRVGFRMRVTLNSSAAGRSRCRLTAELPEGDDTHALLDRLMTQFVRRVEDVARDLQDISAEKEDNNRPAPQEPKPHLIPSQIPTRWISVGVASATAAAAVLAWHELRRRR